jgi:ADP-ribosyl-[dinitrogen reductase] hydrolase
MEPDGCIRRRAGTITDDTLQAIAVAESLIACRGFSAFDLAHRLLSGFRAHPEYYGPTSTQVFRLIEQGVPPQSAARTVHDESAGSRTNGPVMRGPPIGIVYSGRMVEEVSLASARITHFDPVAGASSGFVNRLVSELCRERTKEEAYLAALSGCRDAEVLALIGTWRDRSPIASLDALELAHAAIAVFMSTNSFSSAIERAVNLGGDSDTVGAVTGSLAGACYGFSAIPRPWIAAIAERARLITLADGLSRIATVRR